MQNRFHSHYAVIAFALTMLAVTAHAAAPAHDASLDQIPTADGITQALLRVYTHLNSTESLNVVDRQTKQVITDFSTPNPNASVQLGSYPYGVLHASMLLAGQVTGDKRFTDFTAQRLQLISDRLPYFQSLPATLPGAPPNSLKDFITPTSLDSCGAWGAAMIKARRAGVGPDLKKIIDQDADYIRHKQYRLADGTLARHVPWENSVWGDDMYMSIPFLAQMGKLTGDQTYTDDAVRQALQISALLFDPKKGLYAHGWTAGDKPDIPKFYWGRVNGWCLMAMVELLDVLPENDPHRTDLLKILRAHVKGLASLQGTNGLWHQLLDKPDSYYETSCSAMYVFSMARAINRGWISAADYGPTALAGWNGLTTKITPDGGVEGTCVGTNYSHDAQYYYTRPSRDDMHGYGPVIFAGAEMISLLKNDHIKIISSRGGPPVFTEVKKK